MVAIDQLICLVNKTIKGQLNHLGEVILVHCFDIIFRCVYVNIFLT